MVIIEIFVIFASIMMDYMAKRIILVVLLLVATFASGYWYLYNRWKYLWALENPRIVYPVLHHQDDTLRVIMIGDSWVGMRTDTYNNLFQSRMSELIDRPVILNAKGKGGEKSRGIYQLMFETDGYGTKSLLYNGADYCVVFAGINDAAANKGIRHYLYYYKLIIDFLITNQIRPVVVEIPDVNIWNVYGKKPIKDLLGDYLRSTMTGCDMYNYREYREALLAMLIKDGLKNEVIIVPMKDWNGESEVINGEISLDDQIHLNCRGYELLDSCIIERIAEDYKSR